MLLLETRYFLERSICSFSTALSYRCSNSSYVKNATKYIINFQFYCHWYIHISSISNHHTLWDLQNIQSERENKRTRKDSHSWGLRSHHNQWRKKNRLARERLLSLCKNYVNQNEAKRMQWTSCRMRFVCPMLFLYDQSVSQAQNKTENTISFTLSFFVNSWK